MHIFSYDMLEPKYMYIIAPYYVQPKAEVFIALHKY